MGKPTRGRILQMVHDLTKGDGYARCTQRSSYRKEGMETGETETCSIKQKTKEDDDKSPATNELIYQSHIILMATALYYSALHCVHSMQHIMSLRLLAALLAD